MKIDYKVIIENHSDIQKLLHIYLTTLGIKYKQYSTSKLILLLKDNFNFEVTERNIDFYYEPNSNEELIDLKLQLTHIN